MCNQAQPQSYRQNAGARSAGWGKVKCMAVLLALFSNLACSIDNPDAPDLIAAFEAKEKIMVVAVQDSDGYRASLAAYTDYLEFLDKELNVVYQVLQSRLPKDKQLQLKQSQRSWLKYRDDEFAFVEQTWTKDDFGSSSSIARGQYKADVVRSRVIQLMHYAKSY